MSTYLYELPTTGAISFADFCADHSAAKNYSSHITDATLQRASLRAALKESKRTEGDERDYLRQVKVRESTVSSGRCIANTAQVIDDYLPQLLGVMSCVAHDEIGLREEPGARPPLSAPARLTERKSSAGARRSPRTSSSTPRA